MLNSIKRPAAVGGGGGTGTTSNTTQEETVTIKDWDDVVAEETKENNNSNDGGASGKKFHVISTKSNNIVVVGMPNVGKSSIINCIRVACKGRQPTNTAATTTTPESSSNSSSKDSSFVGIGSLVKQKRGGGSGISGSSGSGSGSSGRLAVAKTGALPGVTRHIGGFQVSDNPPAFLIDSPGIFVPRIDKSQNEIGLKLALTGAIKDSVVGVRIIADYLLHCLNTHRCYSYLVEFAIPSAVSEEQYQQQKLAEPGVSDISILLHYIGQRIGAKTKAGEVDEDAAAKYFIQRYRQGALGRITLDNHHTLLSHQQQQQV